MSDNSKCYEENTIQSWDKEWQRWVGQEGLLSQEMELRLEWDHWRLGENNFLNRRTSVFRVYSRFLSFLWSREEEEDSGSDDNGGSKTIILG